MITFIVAFVVSFVVSCLLSFLRGLWYARQARLHARETHDVIKSAIKRHHEIAIRLARQGMTRGPDPD